MPSKPGRRYGMAVHFGSRIEPERTRYGHDADPDLKDFWVTGRTHLTESFVNTMAYRIVGSIYDLNITIMRCDDG